MTKPCAQNELIRPYGFSPVLQVREKLVPSDRPEFPVYVAIKFFMYEQVDKLFHLKPSQFRARLKSVVRGLTARRVHHIVTNGGGTQGQRRRRAFTDFFDTTSHLVKKRMDALNHGTILCVGGKGFRKAVAYRWNEPVDQYTLKSYRHLNEHLGDRLSHALDLFRLEESFHGQAFTRDEAVKLFQQFRQTFLEGRWFTGMSAKSTPFVQFLMDRLSDLENDGMIARTNGSYRLTETGQEVTNWFDLFINSVAYK